MNIQAHGGECACCNLCCESYNLTPVTVYCTGQFSPATKLESFVRLAGPALSTVTNLDLVLKNVGGTASTAARLDKAVACVVQACPALNSFTFEGRISQALMQSLGNTCSKLSTFGIMAGNEDIQSWQEVVQQAIQPLPSLLPQVRKLVLPEYEDLVVDSLPDMSGCVGVHTLEVRSFQIQSSDEWSRLPPNLTHLSCKDILSGPVAAEEGGPTLKCLKVLEVLATEATPVSAVAQILRSAPALTEIKANIDLVDFDPVVEELGNNEFLLLCPPIAATAADLTLLHQRVDTNFVMDANYLIRSDVDLPEGAVQAFIDGLPSMARVTNCSFVCVLPVDLGPLLSAFSSLLVVRISSPLHMDDVALQSVAACLRIKRLELCNCNHVSPMGLLALCQRLPSLQSIACQYCDLLKEPFLDMCVQLLARDGLSVKIEDWNPHANVHH